jgi:hypothetical protein
MAGHLCRSDIRFRSEADDPGDLCTADNRAEQPLLQLSLINPQAGASRSWRPTGHDDRL